MDVVIHEYKKYMHAIAYSKSTITAYSDHLRQFKKYLDTSGIEDIRQVTKKTIDQYHEMLLAGTNAPATIAVKLRAVKRLFEYLTDSNRLLINPTEHVKDKSRDKRRIGRVMTLKEIRCLLDQPNLSFVLGIRDRAILEVLYGTGIRLNEFINLTVYDADLSDKVLYIRKGKGRKQRVVPLGGNAAQYVKEYLNKIRPRYAKKNPKERTLFLSRQGNPINTDVVRTMIRKYQKSAGIKKNISPHTFRRTCATHMLQNGADIRYIQKLLGHRSLRTTQIYTQVMTVDIKKTHSQTHPASLRCAVASTRGLKVQ